MDFLKKELEKKRKVIQELSNGKKFVKTGELEQRRLEKLREEERQELQKKSSHGQKSAKAKEPVDNNSASIPKSGKKKIDQAQTAVEEAIDKLDLPRAEVVRRLRFLKQPVTFFGEDDDERLTRLKVIMKTGDFDVEEGESTEGQQNDFLRDLRNLKQGKAKVKEPEGKESAAQAAAANGGQGTDDAGTGNKHSKEDDIDSKRFKANFDELCEEDKILVYFKSILREWEVELDSRSETEMRTQQGRSTLATFRQCARYIDPLFRMCRRKQLYDDIKDALSYIVAKCRERDYLAAMDKYIKLAIGNAPWPIGVTMVGIHERSAREKIHTNSVAHIMNDETTRKYLQSVKRLMTLAQRKYPALPSKSVEFNSLANGSDLESLKREVVFVAESSQPDPLKLTNEAHEDEGEDAD